MVGLVASSQRSAAPAHWRFSMSQDDFPAPQAGFVVTHFLVVSDQDRSREFYRSVFGATVLLERDPVIFRLANSWLILNVGGGPTDDKPTVRSPCRPTPIRPARSSTSGWPTSPRPTLTGQPRAPSSSPNRNTMPVKSVPTSATPMGT